MKKFLTIDFGYYDSSKYWKDIGAIPYALSKYFDYKSSLICLGNEEKIDGKYEKYVNLIQLNYKKNNMLKNILIIFSYIFKQANNYDIINMYHGNILTIILAYIAKLKNPNAKIYIKLDLGREYYNRLFVTNRNNNLKYKIISMLNKVIDLYTVETREYVNELNNIKKFHGKVKYLPNGFFSDLVEIDKNIKKEKIILTVGRLGTLEKNTEMLVEAIENIETEKLKNWKIYLVGSMTTEFTKWFNERLNVKPYLKNYFIVTGNISDKKELYTLYAKSSVFVLPSRWESWGLALTEAMAFGCFPIVTDCCDAFYEILDIDNSNFGKIIPNEDKNALKSAIEEVLDNKVDYINNGIKAHEFVSENFDWEIIAQKLDNYFREIYETRLCTKKY